MDTDVWAHVEPAESDSTKSDVFLGSGECVAQCGIAMLIALIIVCIIAYYYTCGDQKTKCKKCGGQSRDSDNRTN